MLSLGFDTSNYATSLAVVDTTCWEVVCAEKQFLPVKEGQLGLRQSDALFHHVVALPKLLERIDETLDGRKIDCVGVSAKPRDIKDSYMPCFLAGETFATAFAMGANVPLVKTNHQQGHIQAALLGAGLFPLQAKTFVFHISGGTTDLLLVSENGDVQVIGTSLDLYAGQAIDRLGVQLGYSFPAGEQVSALAETCLEEVKPKVALKGLDCHLSGLQNQYEMLLKKGTAPSYVAKYCLLSIAVTVQKMVKTARNQYGNFPLVCAGGVMCSSIVRSFLEKEMNDIYFAPAYLSSDNAVGVALIAGKETIVGEYY